MGKDYIPQLNRDNFCFDTNIVHLIPVQAARRLKAFPMFKVNKKLVVALTEPENLEKLDELSKITSLDISPVKVDEQDFTDFLNEVYLEIEFNDDSFKKRLSSSSAIEVLDGLLEEAISRRASDIHIELLESQISIRFRIDGEMTISGAYPYSIHEEVISRIKLISGMDISEKRLPQEGKFVWDANGSEIDLRVVTLPTIRGESAVIRILDSKNIKRRLNSLGFEDDFLKRYRELINKNQGLILICGPTGSGKTTTLYTTIQELKLDKKKIVAIEDPCEYQLDKITQIEVDKDIGLDYESGLKAILRGDPDVILIGEIRNSETARIALEAALTGHLVFATLHTTTCISAIYRLLEMKLPAYMIADSLLLIINQRLVRKLCLNCHQKREISEINKEKIKEVGLDISKIFIPNGCRKCDNKGYRGRTLIFEALVINEYLKKSILLGINDNIGIDFDKLEYISMEHVASEKIENGIISLSDTLSYLKET